MKSKIAILGLTTGMLLSANSLQAQKAAAGKASSKPKTTTAVSNKPAVATKAAPKSALTPKADVDIAKRLATYERVKLTTDTAFLTEAERKCITSLIAAASYADRIFWRQVIGDKDEFLKSIADTNARKFAAINYGPWDRLKNDQPFLQGGGIGEKPLGVNLYPAGFSVGLLGDTMMRRDALSPYTMIKHFEAPKPPPPPAAPGEAPIDLGMMEQPGMMAKGSDGVDYEIKKYSEYYRPEIMKMVMHLNQAAQAIESEDKEFAEYLRMRCGALMSDDYINSDIQWLNLKSHLDIVIGPIENYEDKLTGRKTSYESYVMVRDMEWGKKLEKYIGYLPELQAGLPVSAEYKPSLNGNASSSHQEPIQKEGFPPIMPPDKPLSSLAVFDVVYYGGDCNAGSKTIAVNLPNDETLQTYFGTRRSQLKNTMRAKFEKIVVPISKVVIDPSQQKNITFDAFFNNVMFHEVAHGLGIKEVVGKPGTTVRDALGTTYSALEECKADVLGLYMVTQLFDKKELGGVLDDYYVTFVASVFRSVRFGAASAHGKANMITFNTLVENGAIAMKTDGKVSYYLVNVAKMRSVISALAADLLKVQGDGILENAKKMLETKSVIGSTLQADLNRIDAANIPVDLVFDQGIETLGLKKYFEDPEEKMKENARKRAQQGGGMPGGPGGMGMPGGPGGQGGPGGMGGPGGHGMPMPPPAGRPGGMPPGGPVPPAPKK